MSAGELIDDAGRQHIERAILDAELSPDSRSPSSSGRPMTILASSPTGCTRR